jgi:hypothetical protein
MLTTSIVSFMMLVQFRLHNLGKVTFRLGDDLGLDIGRRIVGSRIVGSRIVGSRIVGSRIVVSRIVVSRIVVAPL